MSLKRITMQDIADACGLSRNTVSKIFNGRGTVPNSTRELVLNKAKELGYSQTPIIPSDPTVPSTTQSITVLSHINPLNHNFGSLFIKAFTDQVCRAGYTVKMYEISSNELHQKKLPPHISLDNTAGILCIELFDKEFLDIVCNLGIPTIIVDGYSNVNRTLIACDFISMENVATSMALTESLVNAGAKTLGFVGDILHCNSFYERWNGFTTILQQSGIAIDEQTCILDSDEKPYGDLDWMIEKIKQMPYVPDAFFCVNDFHAIHLITALKRCGFNIPNDVMVTGFDDSPESRIIDPNLTTASIPSSGIGMQAANILLERIQNAERPYSITYFKTTPIIRESIRH